MASRSKARSRSDGDAAESLKPLVVLILLGTILYGAWSVVSKGPTGVPATADASLGAGLSVAPPFPPQVEIAAVSAPPLNAPAAPASPSGSVPSMPPVFADPTPQRTAAVPAAIAEPTYLSAVPAAPPQPESGEASAAPSDVPPQPVAPGMIASSTAATPAVAAQPRRSPPTQLPEEPAPVPAAAFASSWAGAHDMLAAGRYAEALAALSTWHDDPSLGLEESQRLEDLLGQLAGTVVYSQQDLLLPPYIVEPGETLPSIAAPLGVPWQLLAKINGVADPGKLVPGESLKLVRGPFDAVVNVSRRRLSLRVGGNYAGTFPVIVGRQIRDRVGASLPVVAVERGGAVPQEATAAQVAWSQPTAKSITLGDGVAIAGAADPAALSEEAIPAMSIVVAERDLAELADILGTGSRVMIK